MVQEIPLYISIVVEEDTVAVSRSGIGIGKAKQYIHIVEELGM